MYKLNLTTEQGELVEVFEIYIAEEALDDGYNIHPDYGVMRGHLIQDIQEEIEAFEKSRGKENL